jgi:ribose 5-phosphate isomerase B
VRIAVSSDHAGFELKSRVIEYLKSHGHEVADFGTHDTEPVDYPPYCARVGRAVVAEDVEVGVVLGGSGQGEQIAANKVRGVRAALCHNELTARLARAHNDANVLALGERVLGVERALAIVEVFLATDFEGGRHARRVEQIARIEEEEATK